MEKIVNAFKELKKINEVYDLDSSALTDYMNNIYTEKVCTPVIGKFSSGKSALINTVLGGETKLLKEDITPETAVPTELVYDDGKGERAVVYDKKGNTTELSIADFMTHDFSVSDVIKIRLYLSNEFLKSIDRTMIVDMPGFESTNDAHSTAIDKYVTNSQAYIVVFPADDMTMKSTLGSILKELCIYEMPIHIVITKCDKTDDETRAELEEKLRANIAKYIGKKEIDFAHTSSLMGEIDFVKEMFSEINSKADEIIGKKYKMLFESSAAETITYLSSIINNSQLSESRFAEEEDKLNRELEEVENKIDGLNDNFDYEIDNCISLLKADLDSALSSSESELVSLALQRGDINSRLNSIVRETISSGVKNRLMPIITKYSEKAGSVISIDPGALEAKVTAEEKSPNYTSSIIIGLAAIEILGPIIGPIGVIVGVVLGALNFMFSSSKNSENQKNEVRAQINNNVFPQVRSQVYPQIETTIKEKAAEIKSRVDEKVNARRSTLMKALEDTRAKLTADKQEKEKAVEKAQNYRNEIEEIKNELL